MLPSRRLWLLLLLPVAAVLAVAVPSSGATLTICSETSGKVALQVTPTPATVSPSEDGRLSYTNLSVVVENCGPSTQNHAVLDVGMAITGTPDGCPLLLADQCSVGTLSGFEQRVLSLAVTVPRAGEPVPETELRFSDESKNPNENPESNVEVVRVAIDLTVGVPEGTASTWVPAGVDMTLFSSAGGQSAEVKMGGQAREGAADLGRDNRPFTCPKKLVCRTGPWFTASILDGAAIEGGLTHTLTWPASQVPRKQTLRNLVVLHQRLDANGEPVGEPEDLVACRGAELDCVDTTLSTIDASGLTAVVRTTTNGRMR